MREIGVRELKRSLSQTLRAVADGQQVRVTVRGRPVADLVPAGASAEDDRIRQLVAAGRLVAPTRALPTRAPRLAEGRRGSASSLVLAEREAER
jgi:prevent-host-death family protein